MKTLAPEAAAEPLEPGFEQVYHEHYGLVYRAAYSVTGNTEDAEDVVQTLFLRLFEHDFLSGVKRNAKGFLYRSAVNAALDLIRRRMRSGAMNLPLDEAAPRYSVSPSQNGRAEDVREWLRAALARLQPQEAEVFLLRHVEGYTNAEIAHLLSRSRGAVAITLFRARLRLRKSMKVHIGRQL